MECESDDKIQADDSESDEEDNQDEADKEIMLKANNYREQIKVNKLDYEAHVGLIAALGQLGEFDDLRKARIHMNEIYPLSSDLWMEWLSDEQKICTSEEERKFIKKLFEKAVHEYSSVRVWVEYVMFMLGCGNIEETRNVYEKALMSVGIHLAEGILIWQSVILVEQQMFANMLPPGDEKKMDDQKILIRNLYKRQARVPLMNVDKNEFLSEASKWFDDSKVDPNLSKDFEKSYKKMMTYVKYEEALICAADEIEKLEAYRKYIDVVSNDGNPALIQNIYERTVADLCLNAGLWEEYVRFLQEQFPSVHYLILPVCERSQRNCPWSGALCELHIIAIEKFSEIISLKEADTRVKDALQKILSSGVTVGAELVKAWMAYLVYFRRKIPWEENHETQLTTFRNACEQAIESMEKLFGEEGDLENDIARFYARVEAESAKNIEGARKIWNDLILRKARNSKNASLWLEFINLERSFGTTNYCRKLLRRSLERNWDWVEAIGTAYLQFEQELGNLENMLDFESRYRDRLAIVRKRRLEDIAKNEKETQESVSKPKKGKVSQTTSHSGSTVREEAEHNFKKPFSMQKNSSPKEGKKSSPTEVSSKGGQTHKRPADENFGKEAKKLKGLEKSNNVEVTPPPGYKSSADESFENEAKMTRVDQIHGEFVRHDATLDHRSVFLSNLDYKTKDTAILPIFAECGNITSLRITRDFQGRSKGFGYLTFESSESIEKALKLDRTPVDKRPLFISRCNPREREHAFKYSTGLEKDKLFVRGLSYSLKESDIKEAFEPHGEIKSIRLITHRNGYSKGSCYIDYHDASTAENVIKKMDGAVLSGSKISVQISNPSAAKAKDNFNSSLNTLGNPRQGPSHGGGQRPKLSLIPRSLLRNPTKQDSTPHNGTTNTNAPVQDLLSQPKSNDDFRKLLLN